MSRTMVVLLLASLATWCQATEFALVGMTDNRLYGPYVYGPGTLLLQGQAKLHLQGSAVSFRAATGTVSRASGPYLFTNGAEVVILGNTYRVLLGDGISRGLEEGRQTAAAAEAGVAALAAGDPARALEQYRQAIETNRLARNKAEVPAVVARLEAAIRQEQANIERGLAKFEGRWYPKAEAEALEQKRLEEENTAKGLVLYEGQWLPAEEAAARRREAHEAARKAAEAKRRDYEARKCLRCHATGSIHYEIRPSLPGLNGKPMPPSRTERPGKPPPNSPYETRVQSCPDCNGKGVRE